MRISAGLAAPLVFAACALAAGIWFVSRPRDGGAGSRPDPGLDAPANEGGIPKGANGPVRTDIATLAGNIVIEPADAGVPAELSVTLLPSKFLRGGDTAAPRKLELAGTQQFRAEGVPFGSYELRASAPGFSGTPMDLRLSPVSPYTHVTLRLSRNPDLLGYVRDDTRAPVEQLLVSIAGKTDAGERAAFETRTGADGSFKIIGIPDGRYTATLGAAVSPLRAPEVFEVREGKAPTFIFDVPRLCSIEARVLIPGVEVPVEGVSVTCVRTELKGGGEIESLVTDNDGRVMFRNLLPGKYSILGTRDYFRRMTGRAAPAPGTTEKVVVDAIPILDELIESLNTNPKSDNR
jgi:hypothetical protein